LGYEDFGSGLSPDTPASQAAALWTFSVSKTFTPPEIGDAIFIGTAYLVYDKTRSATIMHEMLHIFFDGAGHSEVADKLGLGKFENDGDARKAINDWLGNGCRK
jgi:hypothetical protein